MALVLGLQGCSVLRKALGLETERILYRPAECAAISRPRLQMCPRGTLPGSTDQDGYAADCSLLTKQDAAAITAALGLMDRRCAE
ncbi:MAG: hypothetical protein MRY63_06330 [Neomegalonema sp.]|nr:hypothetical protein [Neomegalonema sp.]